MPASRGLMSFGLPAQAAKRLGTDPTAVTGAGTSQATAQAIGQFQFYVRAAAGGAGSAYGFVMPTNAEVGSEYTFVNVSTNTVVLWPPTGGGQFNINAGATATGLSLALAKGLFLLAVTATTFDVLLSS
jgi:hypothetical protein